jgi:hypothetical protein
MSEIAEKMGVGMSGLRCATLVWKMWQGGNQWSGYDSFLRFFRHVAKLPLDYTAWDAWETLSLHSGPRIVHESFCIISDRPEILTVDDRNRPHAENGPFCRWRDGSALYAVHGARVPAWIVEHPEQITVAKIDAERNAEIRRVMVDRYKRGEAVSGAAAYLLDSGAEVLDDDPDHGVLYRCVRPSDTDMMMVRVTNNTVEPDGTVRQFFLRVHPELRPMLANKELGQPQKPTARNAVASTWGMRGEYFAPEART